MLSRRRVREELFKMLFRAEFHEGAELDQQLQLFFQESEELSDEEAAYIEEKFQNIREHLTEIDANINEKVSGWKTTRMGKVDLTLIRLALHEIQYEEDIPTGVAINEAVELAKTYGTDDSPAFVNGVLARFA